MSKWRYKKKKCDILKVAPGEAKLPDIQLIIYGKEKLRKLADA